MDYSCVVPFCNNIAKKGNGISFFAFPSDVTLQKMWVLKIKRDIRHHRNNKKPFKVTKHSKVRNAL